MSRYDKSTVKVTRKKNMNKILKDRDIKDRLYHYMTTRQQSIPTANYDQLKVQAHIWNVGDRFYKLANTYYNDPRLWWIIAWYNKKPTEGHVALGDKIYIPLPLEDILSLWEG